MFERITPELSRSLIVFAITLVISLIMVLASSAYVTQASDDQMAAKRAMRIWQTKIDNSVENNQIIDEFESNFLRLVNQGVVGDEDRLSWFETIQNTARKRNMPLVKYSISTQKKLDAANIKREFQGINVFKSIMTLDIDMAHEGDLFAILNDLKKADGLFAIDSCDIEKINKEIQLEGNNMKAYCELGWYTFKGSNAGRKDAG